MGGVIAPMTVIFPADVTSANFLITSAGAGDTALSLTLPAELGGGSSNAISATVRFVAPAITAFNPVSTTLNSAFALEVIGSGFVSGAEVLWNGSPLPTTFGASTLLTATVSAAQTGSVGSASLTVANPALYAAPSAPAAYLVNHPQPSLASTNPVTATAGRTSFVLQATGSNFITGAGLLWNGTLLTDVVINNSTTLTATVPAGVIGTTAGPVTLVVRNPAPSLADSTAYLGFSLTAPGLAASPGAQSVAVGAAGSVTLDLSGEPQAAARSVTLTPGGAGSVSVSPASVTIPFGLTSTSFSATGVLAGAATVTADLTGFGVSTLANFTVVSPTLTLVAATSNIISGTTTLVTATISHAQAADRLVAFSAASFIGSGMLAYPPTVNLPQGQTAFTFTVTGTVTGTARLTGLLPVSAGGLTGTVDITIQP